MKNIKMISVVAVLLVTFFSITLSGCLTVLNTITQQRYNKDSDFNVDFSNYGGSNYGGWGILKYYGTSKTVRIPPRVNGALIKWIGKDVFRNMQLTSVTIPDGVTVIGENAFAENQLTSVIIPDSVTTIGRGAFYDNRLTSIVIGNRVTEIGGLAFQNNQLTNATIPNSVTIIGNQSFMDNQLTSIVIGNRVTEIGSQAFRNNQLSSVTISDSVKIIGDGAFGYNQLASVTIGDSVTSIGEQAFRGNQLSNVIIPDSVTTIGEQAFRGNQLSNVIIPDSVTTIGRGAFMDNQLTSIAISNSVTAIGGSAFQNNRLTRITIGNRVTIIGDDAFKNNQLTDVTIPNNVATISDSAFDDNPNSNIINEVKQKREAERQRLAAERQRQEEERIKELQQTKEQILKMVKLNGSYVASVRGQEYAIKFDVYRTENEVYSLDKNEVYAWIMIPGRELAVTIAKCTLQDSNKILIGGAISYGIFSYTFVPINNGNTLQEGETNFIFRPFSPVTGKTFRPIIGSGDTFRFLASEYIVITKEGRNLNEYYRNITYTYEYSGGKIMLKQNETRIHPLEELGSYLIDSQGFIWQQN